MTSRQVDEEVSFGGYFQEKKTSDFSLFTFTFSLK